MLHICDIFQCIVCAIANPLLPPQITGASLRRPPVPSRQTSTASAATQPSNSHSHSWGGNNNNPDAAAIIAGLNAAHLHPRTSSPGGGAGHTDSGHTDAGHLAASAKDPSARAPASAREVDLAPHHPSHAHLYPYPYDRVASDSEAHVAHDNDNDEPRPPSLTPASLSDVSAPLPAPLRTLSDLELSPDSIPYPAAPGVPYTPNGASLISAGYRADVVTGLEAWADAVNSGRALKADLGLVEDVLEHICRREGEGAVLVFLASWEEISALQRQLERNRVLGQKKVSGWVAGGM